MPIVGTTVAEDGSNLINLPVTIVVGIGTGPTSEKNHPDKVDRFLFKRRGPNPREWVVDPEMMKHYYPAWDKACSSHEITDSCPECCRTVKVMLLEDPIPDENGVLDFDNILRADLIWWGQSGWKCRGNGVQAIRKTESNPRGQPWTPCKNGGCADWNQPKKCKASGDLYCILADKPFTVGSLCRVHTSSEWSIRNLHSTLAQIANLSGGKLAGVTVSLKVQWQHATFLDRQTNTRRPTKVPILSIEDDIPTLLENSKKTMATFHEAKRLLGTKRVAVEDPEEDRAQELAPEFHNGEAKQLPSGEPTAGQTTTVKTGGPPIQTSSPPETAKDRPPESPTPEAKPEAPGAPPSSAERKPDKPKPSSHELIDGFVVGMKTKKDKSRGATYQVADVQPVGYEGGTTVAIVLSPVQESYEQLVEAFTSAQKQAREVEISCDVYDPPKPPGNKTRIAVALAFKVAKPQQAEEPDVWKDSRQPAFPGLDYGWMEGEDS